jgi:hypothetical protein
LFSINSLALTATSRPSLGSRERQARGDRSRRTVRRVAVGATRPVRAWSSSRSRYSQLRSSHGGLGTRVQPVSSHTLSPSTGQRTHVSDVLDPGRKHVRHMCCPGAPGRRGAAQLREHAILTGHGTTPRVRGGAHRRGQVPRHPEGTTPASAGRTERGPCVRGAHGMDPGHRHW